MQTTVVKWGNSQGIRLPKTFLQSIQIAENDPVDVILEKEKIIIKKSSKNKHKTTKERLTEFYGLEFDKKRKPQKEIEWGNSVGKEVW
jgi:antitoxin MazE